MAFFCPVAPLPILEGLLQNSAIGRQHLLLAHDIVKPLNRERYSQIFAKMLGRSAYPEAREFQDRKRLIILDNSVIELGNSVTLNLIMDAAQIVQPTCLVLPDVMLKTQETIDSCSGALDAWFDALQKVTPSAHHSSLMYVPQGISLGEFTRCAEAMVDDERIKFWGIPRNVVPFHGSRQSAIRICAALNPKRKIHMLGFSDNMVDDFLCSQMPEVYSIDSAVPLRIEGKFSLSAVVPARLDWWEKAKWDMNVLANTRIARELFNKSKNNVRNFD